ncbi:adenine phosphoribosyltransferase [Bradyrhizobium sp. 156]|uniref:adenine phosphoribosyltransferase n=1 Tax=Bradyrhizobium sp. 156 TaxID=2782630 RepID=UPI001FFAE4D0|nr:adenine phosphoribosyltransferase [Bradyrhizobium sp. 156]MCK1326587.1 adenine phosphoribosyltransferase [Bradyrhizobium sp. 156]
MEVDWPVLGTELHLALRGALREVPHFPISGILFKDISPMLARPAALADAVSAIEPVVAPLGAEAVLAIDARGFVLGSALSDRLRSGLVLVRKPGKLPGEVQSFDYTCEYCSSRLEVTAGLIQSGLKCLVVDDLLATGGTARATANLVISQGATVVGYAFMLEIEALKGREQLDDAPVVSLLRV